MKATITFLALLMVTASAAIAQPDSVWCLAYGGMQDEVLYSVVQTEDGGFVLGAQTASRGAGNHDFWLIRTNGDGDTLWSRTFGGSQNEWIGNSGRTQSGYFLAGSTWSFGAGGEGYMLVKTDSVGNQIFRRTYGGPQDDQLYWGQYTASDGGFILAGYTNSFGAGGRDGWLLKTNSTGDSMWSRTFGGVLNDALVNVTVTDDGDYVLCGIARSFGDPDGDFWLIKTNANGETLWSRMYGNQWADLAWCVRQTEDGGYVVAGYTTRSNGVPDVWLIKTDENGDSLWSRTYGVQNLGESALSVVETQDGGYAITGGSGAFAGSVLLLKTNAEGNLLWSRTFGGSLWEEAYDIIQIADGSFVIASVTRSFGSGAQDAWLIKTEPDVGAVEGGETCETAMEIPGIPFVGLGNTSDNADNINPPFAWPGGRDVAYRYTPTANECVDISLCGSSFDTRLIVYQGVCSGLPYRINDDACPSVPNPWTSELLGVNLIAGTTYYIVVDGYENNSNGNYEIEVVSCGPPWVADEPCAENSLFGQPHINEAYGWVSDSTWAASNLSIHDNFSGVSGAICAVVFWGVTNTSGQVPCTQDPLPFEIVFRQDSLGYPGSAVSSHQAILSRVAAGVYNGFPVWKYTMGIAPCVTLEEGWISVQAGGNNDGCYFAWSHSPVGDFLDWQYLDGVPAYRTYTDHAFCFLPLLAAESAPGVPEQFALHQNYPNPFNSSTTIRYDLPRAGKVTLKVFDLLGRELAVLKDGFVEAGTHQQSFDASGLASGLYFARLDAGELSQTKKLMLLK